MDREPSATIKPKEHPRLLASVNLVGGLAGKRAKNKPAHKGAVFTINASKTKLRRVSKKGVKL